MASECCQTDVVSLLLDHGANIHEETEVDGFMYIIIQCIGSVANSLVSQHVHYIITHSA